MNQLTIQQAIELGWELQQAGRLQEAEQLYRQILAQVPKHADAWHLLGVIAAQMGQHDEAVELIRRAMTVKPNWPDAQNNLGNVLGAKGLLDEAIAAYRQALALRPDFPEAHHNLGLALQAKGQLDQAIAAYRQAIVLNPNYHQAYSNLGVALNSAGHLDQAIAACQHAVALKSNSAKAHNNLAGVLKDQGQLDQTIAAYRQAIALDSGYFHAHSNLVLILHYHPGYDAAAIAQELGRWNQQHAEPLKNFIQPHNNEQNSERRLRVGYVSGDFCTHASANFLVPLLEHHDRQQVEVFCYAQVPQPDEMTHRLQQSVSCWRSTVGLSDAQVAGQIRQDAIDILVDLKVHTANNRLLIFARKPAPVQVTWLGYPGSTGLTTMDYRLSDPYLDPPGMDESIYSEKTIRLPDCFWCYDPLDGRDVPVRPLPALANGFVTFGCLNNFCKINSGVLTLWAKVLKAAPRSRLLLLAPEGAHRAHTLDWLQQQEIDPTRVEFVALRSRREYLALYHRIDLGLDSFPYNGHTTSLDSLWMGVPVVSLLGQTAVGRAGWCQLSNLGLAELAAQTPEQFAAIAVNLARDLPRLQQLRSTLRQRMEQSPLMDAPRFARNMEAAYRQMWHGYCANNNRS